MFIVSRKITVMIPVLWQKQHKKLGFFLFDKRFWVKPRIDVELPTGKHIGFNL